MHYLVEAAKVQSLVRETCDNEAEEEAAGGEAVGARRERVGHRRGLLGFTF